jgi:hypothetical protein
LVVAAMLALLPPLRNLTTHRAASPKPPAVEPPDHTAPVHIALTSTKTPFHFEIDHLGKPVWTGDAADNKVEKDIGLADSDLWSIYAISFIVLPLLVDFQRPLLLTMFEPSVAASQRVRTQWLNYLLIGLLVLSMISSLQAVGVILALGMLIAPAATIYLFSDSFATMFWGGGAVGLAGSCAGLAASYWLNLPTGACIVLVLGLIFLCAYFFSPRYGLISKVARRGHLHEESLARWKNGSGRDSGRSSSAREPAARR